MFGLDRKLIVEQPWWQLGIFTLGLATIFLDVRSVSAQSYPSKPVRLVSIGPGGSHDYLARNLAPGLTAALGQQVIVDNRPSGFIPAEVVARAAPDGYTLLASGGALWIGPLLADATYDVFRDFAPISLTTTAPLFIVVHPSLPVKSVKELIALAKARPGTLNYSSAGNGSSSHLGGALFTHMAGVNIVRIPYRNGSTRMASLIAGEVQMEVATPGSVSSYIKAGRVRPLAVTTAARSALFPALPTVSASGLPGYEYASVGGLFAPGKTPPDIINRLSQETVRYLKTPEAKERFFAGGVEVAGTPPENLASAIKSEVQRLSKLIKDANIRVE